jgi:hypothetical protein
MMHGATTYLVRQQVLNLLINRFPDRHIRMSMVRNENLLLVRYGRFSLTRI